jgi:hypothetical protein
VYATYTLEQVRQIAPRLADQCSASAAAISNSADSLVNYEVFARSSVKVASWQGTAPASQLRRW